MSLTHRYLCGRELNAVNKNVQEFCETYWLHFDKTRFVMWVLLLWY